VSEPRILVVYGYHNDEQFSSRVARILESRTLPGVSVTEYRGERIPRDVDLRSIPLRRFLRTQPGADYVIDLHDSARARDYMLREGSRYPAISFSMLAKRNLPRALTVDLDGYLRMQEEVFGRQILRSYVDGWRDASSKYDLIWVDYFSHYTSINRSSEFLTGLVATLSRHPRRA
jgi:hypothetical protein